MCEMCRVFESKNAWSPANLERLLARCTACALEIEEFSPFSSPVMWRHMAGGSLCSSARGKVQAGDLGIAIPRDESSMAAHHRT